jgi:hypothetical protein
VFRIAPFCCSSEIRGRFAVYPMSLNIQKSTNCFSAESTGLLDLNDQNKKDLPFGKPGQLMRANVYV